MGDVPVGVVDGGGRWRVLVTFEFPNEAYEPELSTISAISKNSIVGPTP